MSRKISTANFCLLPFVAVDTTFAFGPVEVWPSTEQEWQSRFRQYPKEFLETYLDSQGQPVRNKASVLTRTSDRALTRMDWRTLVEVLYAVAWLNDNSGSDAWHLNVFNSIDEMNPKQVVVYSYKFTQVYTNSAREPVRAPTHVQAYEINASSSHDTLKYLGGVLDAWLKDDKAAAAVVRCCHYIFSARFESPFYSNPWRDIALIWSALEALYEVPRYVAEDGDKIGRDRFIFKKIKDELTLEDEQWLIKGIDLWLSKAYDVRNAYSHGGSGVEDDLAMGEYDSSIYGMGMRLLRLLLCLRIRQDEDVRLFIAPSNSESVYAWFGKPFISEEYRKLIFALNAGKKSAFSDPDTLSLFHRVCLWDRLPSLPGTEGGGRPNAQTQRAAKTIALVLSDYTNSLPESSVVEGYVSGNLVEMFEQVKAWHKEYGDWGVVCKVAAQLKKADADSRRPYETLHFHRQVKLPESVPLPTSSVELTPWDLADVLIKIVKAAMNLGSAFRSNVYFTVDFVDKYLDSLSD